MKRLLPLAVLALALPASAQDDAAHPSPDEIVNAAPESAWLAIAPEDLLVMELAPDRDGNGRQVVIQLLPPPFSQGWVENIRQLARAHWWDGTSVYRVQDNYVVQWGGGATEKEEPAGLNEMPESAYLVREGDFPGGSETDELFTPNAVEGMLERMRGSPGPASAPAGTDAYAPKTLHWKGWPIATDLSAAWPTHCYGMVGVARGMSPNTGSGAELYTVIGHAPRHLDRNIALAGRIVEGMENLSSLPRGSGSLGFYEDAEAEKRVPILSVRLASELPEGARPSFEYLATDSGSFAAYADARANRRDPFFIHPAGGADICNVPVPVRRAAAAE